MCFVFCNHYQHYINGSHMLFTGYSDRKSDICHIVKFSIKPQRILPLLLFHTCCYCIKITLFIIRVIRNCYCHCLFLCVAMCYAVYISGVVMTTGAKSLSPTPSPQRPRGQRRTSVIVIYYSINRQKTPPTASCFEACLSLGFCKAGSEVLRYAPTAARTEQ